MRVEHAPDEGRDAGHGEHTRPEDRAVGPTPRPRFGERPGGRTEAHHGQACPDEVEAPGRVRVARLRHRRVRARDDDRGDRQVDQERPAPSRTVDEPPAEERADRAGDTAQSRPRPDGCGPVALPEAHLQDREAAGGEQRSSDSLHDTCYHEHLDVRRRTAQQ